MKLILLRHGESIWNKENLFTGWTDVELSQRGTTEAVYAGRELLEHGFDFDICYTSYLKRAIHTLNLVLREMDREWLPVIKDWRLNERHYGALQGLNKRQTAREYGDEQVLIWRRSFDVPPPPLDPSDMRNPAHEDMYRDVNKGELPLGESLKDTIDRVLPCFEHEIKPQMMDGKRVLLVAHGNSIRALVKYFDKLGDDEILNVNIPTGIPLLYEFDSGFTNAAHRYIGDDKKIKAQIESVASQGKTGL